MRKQPALTIDDYIAECPDTVRAMLVQLRQIIRTAIPNAEEAIAYQIPTFRLHGRNLVHFAGFAQHVGLYPVPVSHLAFMADLAPYASGKATAQFKPGQPVPVELVERIVRHLLAEAEAEQAGKGKAH
jgi:uncharacterized protein YdhG (YjbR/CyaY superfamily)